MHFPAIFNGETEWLYRSHMTCGHGTSISTAKLSGETGLVSGSQDVIFSAKFSGESELTFDHKTCISPINLVEKLS